MSALYECVSNSQRKAFILVMFLKVDCDFSFEQVPTASMNVEGNPALNRVRWTHSGREIAVGDSEGQIFIYDVGEVRWSLVLIIFSWSSAL